MKNKWAVILRVDQSLQPETYRLEITPASKKMGRLGAAPS